MTTITTIAAEDLKARLERDEHPMIIDVRTPAEFESLHIKGAYNVPLSMISEHSAEFAERFTDGVVLVCQSGARASDACQRLATAGLDSAQVLSGGTAAYDGNYTIILFWHIHQIRPRSAPDAHRCWRSRPFS